MTERGRNHPARLRWGGMLKPTPVWSLLVKDWRCLLHDRHGLAALFIMPALFILIMSLVMQEAMSYDYQPQMPAIGIINAAPAALGHRQLAKRLQADLHARVFTDQAVLLDALEAKAIGIGIILSSPAATDSGDIAPLRVDLLVDDMTLVPVVNALRSQIEQDWGQQLPSLFIANADPIVRALIPSSMLDPALIRARIQIKSLYEIKGHTSFGAVQRVVPAWLAFAIFFIVLPLSAVFVQERQLGTLKRLQTMGVGNGSLILAKALCFGGVNGLQVLIMLVVGVFLVPQLGMQPLSLHFDGLALGLMTASTSLAALGLALALSAWARSVEQASLIGGALNVMLAAIGGIMVPKAVMPLSLQAITELSPLGWANEGLVRIFLGEQQWSHWLSDAARLCAFGIGMLCLAAWQLRAQRE
jgi:ABC-2 type transport system permease protein